MFVFQVKHKLHTPSLSTPRYFADHLQYHNVISDYSSGFRTLPKNTLRSRKPENNVGPNNTRPIEAPMMLPLP